MLRRVGFFREFRGVGAPSLVDAQSGVSFDRRAQSYLQGGTVLVAVPGVITWPETGRVAQVTSTTMENGVGLKNSRSS